MDFNTAGSIGMRWLKISAYINDGSAVLFQPGTEPLSHYRLMHI